MSRPEKYTVDYFPHDAAACQSKTLSIIFTCFGHVGLSVWWLLLELLSRSKNHIIDIRNTEDKEFLSSITKVSVTETTGILQKLVNLGALNKIAFEQGYIWSDNFIQRISPVYKKRGIPPPTYETAVSGIDNISITRVSVTETTQSKVKYSIVKKRIEKKKTSYTSEEIKSSDWYKGFLKDYPAFNEKEFDHCLVWLEEHPKRKLNKSFLVNWAKKCSDKTAVGEQSLEDQVTKW